MNLIEGIQAECRRVREELVPRYEALGTVGVVGKTLILWEVEEGEAAIASGDVTRMVVALRGLRGCE